MTFKKCKIWPLELSGIWNYKFHISGKQKVKFLCSLMHKRITLFIQTLDLQYVLTDILHCAVRGQISKSPLNFTMHYYDNVSTGLQCPSTHITQAYLCLSARRSKTLCFHYRLHLIIICYNAEGDAWLRDKDKDLY